MAEKQQTALIKVSNMTCTACEWRIESSLSKEPGVMQCKASYAKGEVLITYNAAVTGPSALNKVLSGLHYPAVENAPPPQSKIRQWISSALIMALILAGAALLDQTGIFHLFPMANQTTALPVLFVVGLLTSVHCIAMCGGINLSQCTVTNRMASDSRFGKLLPSLLYNGGRVLSYTVIGGIVGLIGTAVTPSGGFRGMVAIAASAFMLLMGLNMLGIFPALRKRIPHMPKWLAKKVTKGRTGKGPFVVGLLNGLMPCGPLQSMQLYALSTGSLLMGALSMFLFSLGTVPLMFGLGALSSFLSDRFTGVMLRVSAMLVMFLGLMMLNNGLSLLGFHPLF